MVQSLACQSRRPHPNQHTEAELKLIRDMRHRNPNLGIVELWHRLRQRQRGYTRPGEFVPGHEKTRDVSCCPKASAL